MDFISLRQKCISELQECLQQAEQNFIAELNSGVAVPQLGHNEAPAENQFLPDEVNSYDPHP